MKSIDRRLRKLEQEFGSADETYFSKRLRERLEAGRRRVAEAQDGGEGAAYTAAASGQHSGWRSVRKILEAGRLRTRNAAAEMVVAVPLPGERF